MFDKDYDVLLSSDSVFLRFVRNIPENNLPSTEGFSPLQIISLFKNMFVKTFTTYDICYFRSFVEHTVTSFWYIENEYHQAQQHSSYFYDSVKINFASQIQWLANKAGMRQSAYQAKIRNKVFISQDGNLAIHGSMLERGSCSCELSIRNLMFLDNLCPDNSIHTYTCCTLDNRSLTENPVPQYLKPKEINNICNCSGLENYSKALDNLNWHEDNCQYYMADICYRPEGSTEPIFLKQMYTIEGVKYMDYKGRLALWSMSDVDKTIYSIHTIINREIKDISSFVEYEPNKHGLWFGEKIPMQSNT